MRSKIGLTIILIIAIAGMIFSGYLSYTELTQKTCALGGGCSSLIGIPTCVYGFIMYFLVFLIALLCLLRRKREEDKEEEILPGTVRKTN